MIVMFKELTVQNLKRSLFEKKNCTYHASSIHYILYKRKYKYYVCVCVCTCRYDFKTWLECSDLFLW